MPKLKDKVYGEMIWEQWEDDLGVWYSRMKDDEYEMYEIYIHAKSPMDFLAVGRTHKTYQNLMLNLPFIQTQAAQYFFKNSDIFPKKKERYYVSRIFSEMLEMISITIYEDLSSEIHFLATVLEENDSTMVALVNPQGEFIEAFIEND